MNFFEVGKTIRRRQKGLSVFCGGFGRGNGGTGLILRALIGYGVFAWWFGIDSFARGKGKRQLVDG